MTSDTISRQLFSPLHRRNARLLRRDNCSLSLESVTTVVLIVALTSELSNFPQVTQSTGPYALLTGDGGTDEVQLVRQTLMEGSGAPASDVLRLRELFAAGARTCLNRVG